MFSTRELRETINFIRGGKMSGQQRLQNGLAVLKSMVMELYTILSQSQRLNPREMEELKEVPYSEVNL
mgnify:CR=1 FL=1